MFLGKIHQLVASVYQSIGVGKRLEAGSDAILVLGGTSTATGRCLCKVLAKNSTVINIDTVDIVDLEPSGSYTFIQCDSFTSHESIVAAMAEVVRQNFHITVFICNLQEGHQCLYNPTFESTLNLSDKVKHLEQCVTVNVTNAMIATKYFLNELVPATIAKLGTKTGFYIINISCEYPGTPLLFASHYLASKVAFNQFHDGLASELQKNSLPVAEQSTSPKIKTLLVFIPFSLQPMHENIMSPIYVTNLVKFLQEGRKGVLAVSKVCYKNHRNSLLDHF